MRIFFSGGGSTRPEDILDEVDIMLSFYDMNKKSQPKPNAHFQRLLELRQLPMEAIPDAPIKISKTQLTSFLECDE